MIKDFTRGLLLLFLAINLIFPISIFAQPKDWSTDTSTKHACVVDGVATIQGFECIFYNILQVIVFLAGIASFFMFVIGGFKYLFSENDPKKTAAAGSTITMAIIGVVGVILSWLIFSLISQFTGVYEIQSFSIPGWQ